jgi:hypothetical protein
MMMKAYLFVVLAACGVLQAQETIPFASGKVEFDPVPAGNATTVPDYFDLGGGEAVVVIGKAGSGLWKQDGWEVSAANLMPWPLATYGSLALHWRSDHVMMGGGAFDFPLFIACRITDRPWTRTRVTVQYDGTPVFLQLGGTCVDLPPRFGQSQCGAPLFNGWEETIEFTTYRSTPSLYFRLYALGLPGADFVIKDVEIVE